MNKFGKKLVIALLAGSMLTTPVYAAPNADDIRAEKEQKEKEVQSIRGQLQEMVAKISDLESKMINKGEEIEQAKKDLEAAEKKQKEQYEAMKLRIKYMYEQGDTQALEDLFTSRSITEFLNKADYIETVHSYDRKKLEEYVKTKEKIKNLKDSLEKDLEKMENMQKSFTSQKSELDVTLQSKQAEVENLNEELQAAVRAAQEEARRKAEQEAKEKAEREAREKAEREAAAQREQASAGGQSNTDRGGSTSSNTGSSSQTDGSKGGSSSGSVSKPAKPSTGGSASVSTGNTSTANAIISAARSQIGTPYKWGGTRPGVGLDCSGLVQYAHRAAGISIGRTSGDQGSGGRAVSNPQPGDVVCWVGHVGIYIGGGKMIHAPEPGKVVCVASVYGSPWYRRYW